MSDDSTVFVDAKSIFKSTEQELDGKPAALVILRGKDGGKLFDLIDKNVSVGRNPDNTITLESESVSRYHFKLSLENQEWTLQDANSINGTYVNNEKIKGATALKKGDTIKVGNVAIKYIPQGDPERLSYDKLQWEANRDLHTGCYNKTYFTKALDLQFKKAKVSEIFLSLIVFDIDHFKKINDTYGHDAGDYVLKEITETIQKQSVRPSDIFARYGGEEFVILLLKTEFTKALEIAEDIRKGLEAHNFIYEDRKFTVTASFGVADYKKDVPTSADLFKRADSALYKAKSEGRNNVQFYKD